jgi:prepilin-type N-terminal cleavage/methylation domain-containing protein
MSLSIKQKRQQGFTLVEVIVVAIIVAALAAVAIPLYNGYVTSSKNNAAANAAGSVASFMGACANQTGTVTGIAASASVFTPGQFTITCTIGATVTTITVPAGIMLRVTSLTSPGSVVANGGTTTAPLADQTYSF